MTTPAPESTTDLAPAPHHTPGLPARRGLVPLLAAACGIAVSNIYIDQPLIGLIAQDLGIGAATAGLTSTAAQLGYALGIVLLVPLGDLAGPRRLVTVLLTATACCLAAAAVAPGLPVLLAATTAAAFLTVVPQLLIPLSTRLVPPERVGRTVAWLVTGLMFGLFGSRILAGLLGEAAGWRSVQLCSAALTLLTALLLRPALPVRPPGSRRPANYRGLLAGLPRLLLDRPLLRQACQLQFCWFSVFIASWTVLSLQLTGPRFGWSTAAAGLSGLVGLAAATLAPVTGRLADRHGPTAAVGSGLAVVGVAVAVLALAGNTLIGLAAGMFALTAGVLTAQAVNQARVLADAPDARSSVNTLFMAATFLGGTFGSAAGQALYGRAGWIGLCVFTAVMIALAVVRFIAGLLAGGRRHRPSG